MINQKFDQLVIADFAKEFFSFLNKIIKFYGTIINTNIPRNQHLTNTSEYYKVILVCILYILTIIKQ